MWVLVKPSSPKTVVMGCLVIPIIFKDVFVQFLTLFFLEFFVHKSVKCTELSNYFFPTISFSQSIETSMFVVVYIRVSFSFCSTSSPCRFQQVVLTNSWLCGKPQFFVMIIFRACTFAPCSTWLHFKTHGSFGYSLVAKAIFLLF